MIANSVISFWYKTSTYKIQEATIPEFHKRYRASPPPSPSSLATSEDHLGAFGEIVIDIEVFCESFSLFHLST